MDSAYCRETAAQQTRVPQVLGMKEVLQNRAAYLPIVCLQSLLQSARKLGDCVPMRLVAYRRRMDPDLQESEPSQSLLLCLTQQQL